MENFTSFIQVLVILFLIFLFIMYFGQKIEIKSLTNKFNLLKKMFWGEIDCLYTPGINNVSLELISELKDEFTSFYAKKIKEWKPNEIGNYFLELEKLEDEKKRLNLIYLFRQAITSIPNDILVIIYFRAFELELKSDHLDNSDNLQATKNLILENALKTGKSSRRIKIFYSSLEAIPLKDYFNTEQTLLFEAEMAKIEIMLFNENDRVNKNV